MLKLQLAKVGALILRRRIDGAASSGGILMATVLNEYFSLRRKIRVNRYCSVIHWPYFPFKRIPL